ncbi:hypothetical protein H7F15_03850 [Pontibacter sp. Tf4]|uniref:hypothetical protein n=1 Tax=Pontibacter sp. Tf4 TaxID=2761620 RepID=UPI001625DB45|nr:hypothetical protein [Pontibacter sp. Tf4]MBB6610162.1 hypothetical protein [Pontibacter sp. Tf4]
MIKKLLCWCVLAFLAVSCEESFVTPDPEARGLNYYPLEVGQYRIYDVTDIHYQNDVATETHFQMREWVADSFLDQTNALTYKIIRSVRPNAQAEWLDDSVMTVTKDHNRVILTKDNTRYVIMVFPVQEGKTWQADVLNNRYNRDSTAKENSVYFTVDKPYTLQNSAVYDKTATVFIGEVSTDSTIIDKRREVYARNIGKIYRVFDRKNLGSCQSTDCEDYVSPILDGHERYEVLIEHGKL